MIYKSCCQHRFPFVFTLREHGVPFFVSAPQKWVDSSDVFAGLEGCSIVLGPDWLVSGTVAKGCRTFSFGTTGDPAGTGFDLTDILGLGDAETAAGPSDCQNIARNPKIERISPTTTIARGT
jgi:hypothetical protein